ncbi:MAG: bifunctional glutamate N-acetyltransferase/amino-acid acetyltransferase ArgJ [Elusimicrobia bacterium]|nr:bifunctional glutamate N-acetyltransferase/amino-acid acetyltransferase ArgJ [Elusimicrobiota bacterium]
MSFYALPTGFRLAGIRSGIAKQEGKLDLALFHSDRICDAAALFTVNRVQAAPVLVSRDHIRSGKAQTILANSGCANACTGEQGLRDAEKCAADAARLLSIKKENLLLASTGVIGQYMPMENLEKGIEDLVSLVQSSSYPNRSLSASAVNAILTTDTVPKTSGVQFRVRGKKVTLWGCAKGAGMIHPDLATMLCFILTDAAFPARQLRAVLKKVGRDTFNCLSVDGDTSTNDTVFLLANGSSGVALKSLPDQKLFEKHLQEVCRSLCLQIAADGEGATRVLEVRVRGARTVAEAQRVALTVATSPLVKTAVFGKDANWGRVMAAVGRSGVRVNPGKIDLFFGKICVARKGAAAPFPEKKARSLFEEKVVPVTIRLNQGKSNGTYLTCDFSVNYVKINADYRS